MIGWVILGIGAVVALAALLRSNDVFEENTLPESPKSPGEPTVDPGPVNSSKKAGPSQYDDLILTWARNRSIDPVLIKAIIAKESFFDAMAINPESGAISKTIARNAIFSDSTGGDAALARLRINPSIGLMQVRVTTARDYVKVNPVDLFDPETNIRAGTAFLAWLVSKGVDLSSIEAYNEGLAAWERGVPDPAYQQAVADFYEKFRNDFS